MAQNKRTDGALTETAPVTATLVDRNQGSGAQ